MHIFGIYANIVYMKYERRIEIPKKELEKFYYKENKSSYKIGKIYKCSFQTISNRMKEYGMEPLPRSIIQSKYKKKNFSENKTEKAYIIGFRLGDLNVYKTTKHSKVIVVRCHTTKMEQVEIMQALFCKYGQVSCKENKKTASYHINCFLNESFNFLLPKVDRVEDWISKDNNYSMAFASGYIDAEGNVGVYDGRARFKIDSYDKNIIFWFYKWFLKNDIFCPKPAKIAVKNQIYNQKFGYKYNKDLWRIRVSKQESLLILLNLIKKYLMHKKRIKDLNLCLKNLYGRKNKRY